MRPHLGYATQTWSPQSVLLIQQIERTQRRATKFILELPFSSTTEYKTRLQTLSLLPICYWHEYMDLVLFYKIVNGLVKIKPLIPAIRTTRPTRSSTNTTTKFIIPKCKNNHPSTFLLHTNNPCMEPSRRRTKIRDLWSRDIQVYSLQILYDFINNFLRR